MSRDAAIAAAAAYFDDGRFFADLERRVAIPSTSQEPERRAALDAYLADEMAPSLERLGYRSRVFDNPVEGAGPLLVAERIEGAALPTVLSYGHGDVVRGQDTEWRDGLSPWRLVREGDRIYGRGSADNKGQHTINIGALEAVLAVRGALGFNSKLLIETGEEVGSPGLHAFCEANRGRLAADVLIASDGPRLRPDQPTIFLGARGAFNFDLTVALRAGGHHSGNWGGLLANPGVVLAHALASMTSDKGRILVDGWLPDAMPEAVRATLAGLAVDGGEGAPAIDPDWGEPALTPAEKVFGWTSFEVLAFTTGNPDNPVNAIPPRASAHCQLRFVPGVEPESFLPALRRHLDARGFDDVEATAADAPYARASRLDPDDPWARWAARSFERTSGKPTAVLPNIGGWVPNDAFAEILGLPTIWAPHSYAACSQHAPDEHLLAALAREGLQLMAGLFWDLGEDGAPAAP